MVPSRQIAFGLSRRHLVCNTLVNIHGKPCPEPVSTVAEFIPRRPVLARVPSEGIRLVREKLGRCFTIGTRPGTELVKSLTNALDEFHESGICLSGFDESNLVVSEESPELLFHPTQTKDSKTETPKDLPPGAVRIPGFMAKPDPGKLKFQDVSFHQCTPAGIQANYLDAHSFITKSLLPPEIAVPGNIKHLLKLLKSPESANMAPLISSHVATVPFGRRRGLDLDYIPYIRKVLPYEDRAAEATILAEIPYLDDWIERAKKNKLLELFFNHRRDKYRADATGFLDFYYDVWINRMEWCKSRWFKPDGGYTSHEVEIVMDVTYPDLMPMIQEALWKTNHLKKAHES